MSASGASQGTSSPDCVYCQQITACSNETERIDTRALYSRIKAGSWSVDDDQCWKLLTAALVPVGFVHGSARSSAKAKSVRECRFDATACPVLPSSVTIVLLLAVELSLQGWPAWRDANTGYQQFDDGVHASRVFALLRFVLWVCGNAENRRVLLHHGVLACIRQLLVTMRERRADVFGEDMLELLEQGLDSMFLPDIRSFDWVRSVQFSADAYLVSGAAGQGEPSIKAAVCILFRLVMLLCVRLFDPESQFAEYLKNAYGVESLSEFTMVDDNEGSKGILAELLLVWQRLEFVPSRPRYIQSVLSLGCAIGGILVSGLVDSQQLLQLSAMEAIARPMRWLQADESYLAWCMLVLLAEQRPEFSKWSRAVQDSADGFWQTCAFSYTEYLRPYVPPRSIQQSSEPNASMSAEDKASLDVILSEPHAAPLADDHYASMLHNIHIHIRSRLASPTVEPAVLQKYVQAADDLLPDTRLRRALDTVAAHLALHGSSLPLPSFISSSLRVIYQQLESSVTLPLQPCPLQNLRVAVASESPNGDNNASEAAPAHALLPEYLRFLWIVWTLPLCSDVRCAVFGAIGISTWDLLLTYLAAGPRNDPRSTTGPTHGASCDIESENIMLHRALVLAGWLLMHSSPSSSSSTAGHSILQSSVSKLIFHKVMTMMSVSESAKATYGRTYTLALRASQCILLVCWQDIHRFRLYLHETQSSEHMLSALYQLDCFVRSHGDAFPVDYTAHSLESLSVVSLPDESLWNFADSLRQVHSPRLAAERVLLTTLFLMRAATADSCYACCQADADHVTNGVRQGQGGDALGTRKLAQVLVFRLVWQLCCTPGFQLSPEAKSISFKSALSGLALSGCTLVSQASKMFTITVVRWLLAGDSGASFGQLDVGADRTQLTAITRQWLELAVQWILPSDISDVGAIAQQTRVLTHLRSSLARAALEPQTQGGIQSVQALLVQCGALEELLGLIQLAATVDFERLTSGDTLRPQVSKDSSGSQEPGCALGELVCEALRLLALVTHDYPECASRLADIRGYRTVGGFLARIAAKATAAGAPIADGVMALLSGMPGPSGGHGSGTPDIDPRWISTMVTLYPSLGLPERIRVLQLIAQGCETNTRASWYWSQSTIARQSIELFQSLIIELSCSGMTRSERYAFVSAYTKHAGRMLVAVMSESMCSSDLKLLFRSLVSGLGDLCSAEVLLDPTEASDHTLTVRQMISTVMIQCAKQEANLCYFRFGGRAAALYAPCFRRISERGFTFAAWFRPEEMLARSTHQQLLNAHLCGDRWLSSSLPRVPSGDEGSERQFRVILFISADRNNGLHILFNSLRRSIEIRLTVSGTRHVIKCADGLIALNRWHSLAMSYVPAKRGWSPFGSSNTHVYLNGVLTYKGAVPFIEHTAYRSCYVGGVPGAADGAPLSTSQAPLQTPTGPASEAVDPFSGRITNVYMFDGPLRTSEVELFHHLGPSRSTQFRHSQAHDPFLHTVAFCQTGGVPASAAALPAGCTSENMADAFRSNDLASRMTVCLDPSACRGAVCLDLSPIGICQSIVRENLYHSARMLTAAESSDGGVVSLRPPSAPIVACDTVDAKARLDAAAQPWRIVGDIESVNSLTIHRAMYLLGGIECTMVLFYHLDWVGSALPPAKKGPLGSDESVFDPRSLDCAPLPSLLYLLRDLVRGDPRHLAHIRSLNLVALVAHVLEQLPRESDCHLTVALLRAMQALQCALDEQGGLSPATYPETSQLWSQVQRDLLLNLRIWRKADLSTQFAYLKEAHRILCAGRHGGERQKRNNASSGVCESAAGDDAIGVRWILYALFNFYPYDSSQHLAQQRLPQQPRSARRPLSVRTSVLAREASAYAEGFGGMAGLPTASTSDSASAFSEGFATGSDDGYGLGDESGDRPEGDASSFPTLSCEETRRLRRVILHTLELFLSACKDKDAHNTRSTPVPHASKSDVGHLTRHLLYACNRDSRHTKEVLQLLFRCLADGSPNASQLSAKLLNQHGLDALCHIIECDDDSVAAEAINIIVLLLTMTVAMRESESAASRFTNSLRGRAVAMVELDDIPRVLALVRAKRALTPALYRSLLLLAFCDHASLLASLNVDSGVAGGMAGSLAPRSSHVRNLSIPTASALRADDDITQDLQTSFVGAMPARLIQVVEAWSAILELSCAPETDPDICVAVLNDLGKLLDDEPANVERIRSLQTPILDHLVTICVLSGRFADSSCDARIEVAGVGAGDCNSMPTQVEDLAGAYARAADHLELVPHTTLDHCMQSLAIGHTRARKAWIEQHHGKLYSTPSYGNESCSDQTSAKEPLENEARAKYMRSTLEWSFSAACLAQRFVWSSFHDQPTCADDVRSAVFALWALSPTGAVPLAIRLLSFVVSHIRSQLQLSSPADTTRPEKGVLVGNLAALASHVLDVLLNYRQFQEYVAYHHEQLKALSTGASPAAALALNSDRNMVYRSPHSPWDDSPELTQSLVEFMLQLDEYATGLQAPTCNLVLRLVLSGIRSMHLQHVESSMNYLIMLLDRHPALAAVMGQPVSSLASNYSCNGGCLISQKTFAVLGYIHEAYMFAEEQATPRGKRSEQDGDLSEPLSSIGALYLQVFQRYRSCLEATCPNAFAHADGKSGLKQSPTGDEQNLFNLFLQTPEWQNLYRSRCMPAMRSAEEDEMRLASDSQACFATILREHLMRSFKLDAVQVRLAKSAQTSIASIVLPIEAEETALVKKDGANGAYGHWNLIWRRRLRALASPRGPWRDGSKLSQPLRSNDQHWMLDMSENSQRMRRRLTKNSHFEDHHLAASRRDRTGQRAGPKSADQAANHSSFDSEEGVPQLSLSVSGLESGSKSVDPDEEWSLVMPEDLGVVAATSEPGRAHFGVTGMRIALLGSVSGRIELTSTHLRFVALRDADGLPIAGGSDGPLDNVPSRDSSLALRIIAAELDRDLSWQLTSMHQVHFRRYMLHSSAIELFFKDHSSVFFSIPHKKALMQLVWKLASLPGVNSGLSLSDIRTSPSLLARLKLTERWQHGELSNFDYLMALNSVAGRSYNDLSQYPVFPWVISDYTSKHIDLQDPKIYRDLSQPIGALNKKRLRHFIERYESFEDPAGRIQKFHYGTHYSSAASVAYYLIRLEPFASVHVSLQSGKFDHADRQFHSVGDTWSSCLTGPGDVKELVPEFYYLPEFMSNHNRLNLGKRQDGTRLGDVKLPPWASTPEEFVRINRLALESEHVSANLHKWVDLIFGFKQRGTEAVKAHNVFYYLTYEGAVNLDAIQDPVERASVESQIHYFGQTPTQLFTKPHPSRHPHLPAPLYTPLTSAAGQVKQFVLQASSRDIVHVSSPSYAAAGPQADLELHSIPWPAIQTCPSASMATPFAAGVAGLDGYRQRASKEALTVVDSSGRISTYQLTLFTSSDYKFQLSVEPLVEGYCALSAASPASESQHIALADRRPVSYATISGKPEMLMSCAHHDGTVKYSCIVAAKDSSTAEPQQRAALVSAMTATSPSVGMSNAYAGAAVSAMSSGGKEAAGNAKLDAPTGAQFTRSIAGLFGVGSSGSTEGSRRPSAQSSAPGQGRGDAADTPTSPSAYIPLAAQLLDSANAPSCLYLADQQTCIAVSKSGTSAVVGSTQGIVCVLGLGGAPGFGGAGSSIASSDGGNVFAGVPAPALFAAGLADPMDTGVGHTSMAAYLTGDVGAGSSNQTSKWVVRHVLHGHDAAVLDVSINDDHDVVASASADGTIIMWTGRSGRYLRTLVPAFPRGSHLEDGIPTISDHHKWYSRIERVLISAEALVVCYSVSGSAASWENCDRLDPARAASRRLSGSVHPQVAGPDPVSGEADGRQDIYAGNQRGSCASNADQGASEGAALHVYTINGRHLHTRKLVRHLRDIALTRDGKFGVCVSSDSRVAIFDTFSLSVVRQFELPACGCSVAWSGTSEQQIVVGCEGGQVVVISADISYIH